MKSLSLSRPLVIMVIGLPGSGKSFFARQFAEMFAAPLVSSDFVRHAVSPESQFNAAEDALVTSLTQHTVEELLKTGKTFLIDGGLNNRTSRHTISRDAKRYGYGILTIWVQTDEPTSLSRSSRRSDKRQADALNAAMSRDEFERYRKQFTIPSASENIVVISGKHTFTTQARVVLKKLVAPREIPISHDRDRLVRDNQTPPKPHDIQPRRRNVPIN